MDAITDIPAITNEPIRTYAPGSPDRESLQAALVELAPGEGREFHQYIGGEWVPASGDPFTVVQPHEHAAVLGVGRESLQQDAQAAVEAAAAAAPAWRDMAFDDRAAILLKAADLLSGPWRDRLNGATMLGQSKTATQAEIDSACELIDFWRFNVAVRPADSRGAAGVVAWGVEPNRSPPARGVRLRDHPVQLHRHRRQPADRARPHG